MGLQWIVVVVATLLVPALYRRSPSLRRSLARMRWPMFWLALVDATAFVVAVMRDASTFVVVATAVTAAVLAGLAMDAFLERSEQLAD